MSIERQKGKMTLMCDRCEDAYEWYSPGDFSEMVSDAKNDGWFVAKTDGGWEHLCPSCLKISLKH